MSPQASAFPVEAPNVVTVDVFLHFGSAYRRRMVRNHDILMNSFNLTETSLTSGSTKVGRVANCGQAGS